MTLLTFTPLDTLFFRDGRPYNKDESNAQVVSQFPPFAPTLIGAARAAFARKLGWPETDWDTHVKPHFGGGEDLLPVSFSGPYLLRKGRPVFPAPALLVRGTDGTCIRLRPGSTRNSDFGETVRLPEPPTATGKYEAAFGWLTLKGMSHVLGGGLPKAVLKQDRLFRHERRVGNWRVTATRTVSEDNAIYSSGHVRLARNVELTLLAERLPPDLEPDNPAPVAGESRMCWISRQENGLALPKAPSLYANDGVLRYCAILITPLDIEGIGLPKPNAPYVNLPGKLVSACIGRAQRVGGWGGWKGTALGGGEPLPLRTSLPAGSVFFMEADSAAANGVRAMHGAKIGARTEWGFGQLLIGAWGKE